MIILSSLACSLVHVLVGSTPLLSKHRNDLCLGERYSGDANKVTVCGTIHLCAMLTAKASITLLPTTELTRTPNWYTPSFGHYAGTNVKQSKASKVS